MSEPERPAVEPADADPVAPPGSLDSTETPRRGLAPGCLLFIAVGAMLLVFTVVLVWNGRAQLGEIREFTRTEPAWTEVGTVGDDEAAALRTRLESFAGRLEDAEEAAIALTPRELAQAIALIEPLEALRGTFTPREIAVDSQGRRVLVANICFEFNAMFPWEKTPYLVGEMHLLPQATKTGPWLKIVAIESTDGEVPNEVCEAMDQQDPLIGGLRDPKLNSRGSAALEQIRHVELSKDSLILATSAAAAERLGEADQTPATATRGTDESLTD